MGTVYTIGHSSHAVELFSQLLVEHGVQVLVDVRSAPYSRYAPQFDHDVLPRSLHKTGIKYLSSEPSWANCPFRKTGA